MKITKHPLMLSGPAMAAMPVDQGVIRKLEASFEVLSANADAFTKGFYDRLFAAHPALKHLFKTDPVIQRAKLFDSLKRVVAHLKDPAAQAQDLHELGRRHVGYGARPEHYPIVVKLMVESMAAACPQAWTADLSAEWTQALMLVSDAMMAGAKAPPATGAA